MIMCLFFPFLKNMRTGHRAVPSCQEAIECGNAPFGGGHGYLFEPGDHPFHQALNIYTLSYIYFHPEGQAQVLLPINLVIHSVITTMSADPQPEPIPGAQVLQHVTDVHCHPTDSPIPRESMQDLSITICAMSTRPSDQVLVRELAEAHPDKVVPCFG